MRIILPAAALLLLAAATAHAPAAVRFEDARFRLPPRWKLVASPVEEGAQHAMWRGPGAQMLHATRWPGLPPRPGGAMVVEERWKERVAGQEAELLGTSHFQGARDEVLVIFFKSGEARFRFYSRGVPLAQMRAIVRSIAFG